MAVNKYPWVRNLNGLEKPLIVPGLVQAGSTQAIKQGEICAFNQTSTYFSPIDAVADSEFLLAISAQEQFASHQLGAEVLERYLAFIVPRDGDVFEFAIDTARSVAVGDTFILTASDSQTLTYSASGSPVAVAVDIKNYPESGTTLRSKSTAQVMFLPEYSYYRLMNRNLKKIQHFSGATDTLRAEESGLICTNLGSTGTTLTLPQACPAGTYFIFVNMADQNFDVDPGAAGGIYIKGGKQADNKYIRHADIGDYMELVSDGNGDWVAISSLSGADADITVES